MFWLSSYPKNQSDVVGEECEAHLGNIKCFPVRCEENATGCQTNR
jgi:hypothetical protein